MSSRLAAVLLVGLAAARACPAQAPAAPAPLAPCPPGYQIVPVVEYHEVNRHVCKLVPQKETVRHTVYDCKGEPFCLRKLSLPCLEWLCGKKGCDTCDECQPPHCRTRLMKKVVTEEVECCKCVVETVTEKVPVIVHRMVPCPAPAPPKP
jgi:hypothetical protein